MYRKKACSLTKNFCNKSAVKPRLPRKRRCARVYIWCTIVWWAVLVCASVCLLVVWYVALNIPAALKAAELALAEQQQPKVVKLIFGLKSLIVVLLKAWGVATRHVHLFICSSFYSHRWHCNKAFFYERQKEVEEEAYNSTIKQTAKRTNFKNVGHAPRGAPAPPPTGSESARQKSSRWELKISRQIKNYLPPYIELLCIPTLFLWRWHRKLNYWCHYL